MVSKAFSAIQRNLLSTLLEPLGKQIEFMESFLRVFYFSTSSKKGKLSPSKNE